MDVPNSLAGGAPTLPDGPRDDPRPSLPVRPRTAADVAAIAARRRLRRTRRPWPRALVLATAAAVAGALAARELGLPGAAAAVVLSLLGTAWRGAGPLLLAVPAALAGAALPAREAAWPPAGPVVVQGEVLPGIRRDPGGGCTTFRLAAAPHELLVVAAGELRVLPGDHVAGLARLPAQVRRRVEGRLPLVEAEADVLRVTPGGPGLARTIEAARLCLEDALLAAVPGREGGLLCNLVLGSGPPLDEQLRAAHRATGLSHLLAVSGAHVSLLAAMLALAWSVATRTPPLASRGYRVACAALLWVYGCLTGLEPPVLRAVAAGSLLLLAARHGRPSSVAGALALPALLTALLCPGDLFSLSFLLSYAAVLGLTLARVPRQRTFVARWILLPLGASLWAVLTTMPITLWCFGQLAPWTILATPVLSPLVALLLAGGLVTAVLGCASTALASLFGAPLHALAWLYCEAVAHLATLPLAPVHALGRPPALALAAFACLGLAWLAFAPGRRGVAVLCLSLSLPHFLPLTAPEQPGLQLLGVGHGQACLVHTAGGATVLVDCGSLGDPARAAHTVERALAARRRLDLLVVTHADADHTGGVPRLSQLLPITRCAFPAELAAAAWVATLRRRGTELVLLPPGADVNVLPGVRLERPHGALASSNEGSVWATFDLGALRAVVPGDPLEVGTRAWLARGGVNQGHGTAAGRDAGDGRHADVLVLPHHGRANPAAGELLARVRPRLALVSNRDGEPMTPQARLAMAAGVPVLETGRSGTITVTAGPPPLVTTERPGVPWP